MNTCCITSHGPNLEVEGDDTTAACRSYLPTLAPVVTTRLLEAVKVNILSASHLFLQFHVVGIGIFMSFFGTKDDDLQTTWAKNPPKKTSSCCVEVLSVTPFQNKQTTLHLRESPNCLTGDHLPKPQLSFPDMNLEDPVPLIIRHFISTIARNARIGHKDVNGTGSCLVRKVLEKIFEKCHPFDEW